MIHGTVQWQLDTRTRVNSKKRAVNLMNVCQPAQVPGTIKIRDGKAHSLAPAKI